jgi:hypothetical protein
MDDDWEWVDTGAPDTSLMESARTVAEVYEPLVTDSEFDNPINPAEVRLHVADGIRADSSRFDNTWTDTLNYRYHYTEGNRFNYRYDCHPRVNLPEKHFHRPPEARHDDAVPSCIDVEAVRLVTLSVLQLWRDTIDSGDLAQLQQPNPL